MLMSILEEMGVTTVAGDGTVTGDQNPEGDYEDRELVAINREVLHKVGGHSYLPVPEGFLTAFNSQKSIAAIRSILLERMAGSERWAFKDPLTASLMPLWLRVFNTAKLAPLYVVAVRDPAAVATSMSRQYGDSSALAELVWLLRVCDALYYTGGNCLIVHYEDFFSARAESVCQELHEYIYPDRRSPESVAFSSVRIKSALNRAVYSDYEVKNELVKRLYLELSKCRGVSFDHEALMSVVLECRAAMQQFAGWSELAMDFHKKNASRYLSAEQSRKDAPSRHEGVAGVADSVLAQNAELLQRVTTLKQELRLQRIGYSESEKTVLSLHKEMQGEKRVARDLSEANVKLRADLLRFGSVRAKSSKLTQQVSDARQKAAILRKKNEQLNRRLFSLQSSGSYQFARLCVQAVRQPGINTIMLPLRVVKLIFGVWAGRK